MSVCCHQIKSSVNDVDMAGSWSADICAFMHNHLLLHRSANISCPLKPCGVRAAHANECLFGTLFTNLHIM